VFGFQSGEVARSSDTQPPPPPFGEVHSTNRASVHQPHLETRR
jgi:hypothetical protein